MVEIKFSREDKNIVPLFQVTKDSPAWNIRTDRGFNLRPYATANMTTGVRVKVPEGYELEIREKLGGPTIIGSRSINCTNDGEIIIPVKNNYAFSKKLNKTDIVAELVLHKIEELEWVEEGTEKTTVKKTIETVKEEKKEEKTKDDISS